MEALWKYSALADECEPPIIDDAMVQSIQALSVATQPHWTAVFRVVETKSLHACLKTLNDADLAHLLSILDQFAFPVKWACMVREEISARAKCVPAAMFAEATKRIQTASCDIKRFSLFRIEVRFPTSLMSVDYTADTAPWMDCIIAGIWRVPKEGECEMTVDPYVRFNYRCFAMDVAVALGHTHIVDALCALPLPHMSRWTGFAAALILNKLDMCKHLASDVIGVITIEQKKAVCDHAAAYHSVVECEWLRSYGFWPDGYKHVGSWWFPETSRIKKLIDAGFAEHDRP